MPRIGRVVIPSYPHHIVQRGHNKQAVFASNSDYMQYLETLAEFKFVYGVKVYRWSSYRWRTGESTEFSWLDVDPCFESLGNTRSNKIRNYVEFVHSVIPEGEWELIRTSVQRGQLTGNEKFITEVDAILGRRIEHRKQGRPKKTEK